MLRQVVRVVALLAVALAPTSAQADLIVLGTTSQLGSGLADVETVLTWQSPRSSDDAFNVNNRIGVAAPLRDAVGGVIDSFNVSMARGDVIPAPEPAALALFGVGLLALAFRVRRKRGKRS